MFFKPGFSRKVSAAFLGTFLVVGVGCQKESEDIDSVAGRVTSVSPVARDQENIQVEIKLKDERAPAKAASAAKADPRLGASAPGQNRSAPWGAQGPGAFGSQGRQDPRYGSSPYGAQGLGGSPYGAQGLGGSPFGGQGLGNSPFGRGGANSPFGNRGSQLGGLGQNPFGAQGGQWGAQPGLSSSDAPNPDAASFAPGLDGLGGLGGLDAGYGAGLGGYPFGGPGFLDPFMGPWGGPGAIVFDTPFVIGDDDHHGRRHHNNKDDDSNNNNDDSNNDDDNNIAR